jgi:hypothetical protein
MSIISRDHIIEELKRTAQQSKGAVIGIARFESETGIRPHEWGRYWARWSDAQKAAGLLPNAMFTATPDEVMLEKLAVLTRHFGHRPTSGELRLAKRDDPLIPSVDAFLRLGTFLQITEKLRQFANARAEFADVIALLPPPGTPKAEKHSQTAALELGHVYLLKSGRYYKIGHSIAPGQRERQLAIQLPEKAAIVHTIKTDDPAGIEKYWHGRFAEKRLNGEFFKLSQADVSAFRRRKFM